MRWEPDKNPAERLERFLWSAERGSIDRPEEGQHGRLSIRLMLSQPAPNHSATCLIGSTLARRAIASAGLAVMR